MTIYQDLDTLLSLTKAELVKRGSADDLCIEFVAPGAQVAFDHGADTCGGMLFVRLMAAYPSSTFPEEDGQMLCSSLMAYQCEMGLIRPFPLETDLSGRPVLPDAETYASHAQAQFDDMEAMLAALRELDVEDKALGAYEPTGPDGLTVGGIWTFFLSEG